MHPTEMTNGDGYQDRVNVWRVVRWAVTAVASLVLAVLFVTTAVSTQAAAPAPNDDVAYHTMATCNAGDLSCIVAQCQGGNYYLCGYNLGGIGSAYNGFPYGPQNFSTYNPDYYNSVYVTPYYNTAYVAPYYGGYYNNYYNNIYGTPYVNSRYYNTYCPSGNFTLCNSNGYGYGNYCPSGNFSACNANMGNCNSGNYSCYYANGGSPYWRWWEADATTAAPTTNAVYQVQEVTQPATTTVAQPVAAPVAAPQAAPAPAPAQVTAPVQVAAPAPAAPTAQVATGLNAPTQAPAQAPVVDAGGSGVKILSVQTPTAPVAANDGREDGK